MKQFWEKHKVLIIGAITAAVMVVNEMMIQGEVSWKIMAFAGFLALLSYVQKNVRGQAQTIAGIVVTAFAAVMAQSQTGKVTWWQIIFAALAAYLSSVVGPAKPVEYEKSPTIVQAKIEAVEIKATKEEMVPPKNTSDSVKPPIS